MKISIASDHAGYLEKEELIRFLKQKDIEVVNLGTNSGDSVDYPVYGQKAALSILKKESDKGIIICGTGIGISIAANRFKNIRASLCTTKIHAEMTRKHNDSNILALGARMTSLNEMKEIIEVWLNTEFEGGRHQNKILKID